MNKGPIPIYRLLPNFITLLALCLGITSIRYAFDAKWHTAVALILIAAVLDAIDGRVARLLRVSSKFGAELDSLADLVNFGVAPAIIMYLWSLHQIPYKGAGWSIVLFFVTCSAIRLARYNSTIDNLELEESKRKSMFYFLGVPMPAGGILCMLPMIYTFEIINNYFSPYIVATYIIIIGLLMVSKIPTFSIKAIQISRGYVSIVLVLAVVIMAIMIVEPWIILPNFGILYLISIPCSFYLYRKNFRI